MTDADRFLQILSKNFPRLKFPSKRRRFVSGWGARCCTVATDDVSFKRGQAGFPPEVLAEFYERGGPICDTHDAAKPVGKVIAYSILEAGVWIVGEIAAGDKAADTAWRDIIVGRKRGLSIRWQSQPGDEVPIGGLKLSTARRVVEISVVPVPSEPEAGLVIGRFDTPTATPTVSTPSTRSRMAARAKLFLKEVLHQ